MTERIDDEMRYKESLKNREREREEDNPQTHRKKKKESERTKQIKATNEGGNP